MDFAGAGALLIGTGTHQPGSDLPDIPAVARTLDDLRAALLDRCGLGEVRVELDLRTPLELGSAISEAASSAAGPLIVYYVGHGLVSRRGGLYLASGVTRSGPLHLEHTGLPYDTMRRYLLDNVDAPVAVILDCCFSGRAIEGMAPPWDEVAGLSEITGAYVLTSAGRSEPSFAPEGLAHTAFSGALLRLLREGDPHGDPYLTLHDVHRSLSRTLPASGFPRPRARSTGRVGELRLAPNPAHHGFSEGVRLSPPGRPEGSPYKGLAAFGEPDAALFFGRERLVTALVRELAADPVPLIVTGASGSGKSSLLRAGLLPALAQGALGFPATAAVITPGDPVPDVDVLVVDQVEEAELPAEIFARDGLLVLGVRSDFLGRCASVPELRTALERGPVIVGPMTEQELREAIERPALAYGLTLEPGLVELLLRDVGAEPGRLPLLSHALLATWQQRRGAALTVAGYRHSGEIAGALAATADDVLAGLDSADEARALFRRLVRVGEGTDDTRRRVPLGELPVGREVVDAFAADDARLLTLDGDTVVITHEALLTAWPVLRSWIEADRAGMLVEQHLVDSAADWDGDPGGLYQGSRLALAREWALGRSLGPPASRFLAASVLAAERRARRRVLVTSVLSGLLVVSLIASAVAVLKYQDAERERRVAAGRALIFQADAVRQADPLAALRLGIAAVRASPGEETSAALAADAAGMAFRSRLTGLTDSVNAVAVSPDGTRGLTGDWHGRLLYWDLGGARRLGELPSAGKGAVYGVRFSSDGLRAVVVWQNVAPEVWSLAGPVLLGRLGAPGYSADFSGDRVVVGAASGVSVWDVSGKPRLVSRFGGVGWRVALRGNFVIAGDLQGSGRLWDLRRGTSVVLPAPVTSAEPNLGVALSESGRLAVVGDRVWDVSGKPRLVAFLVGHDSFISEVAFAPGDRELVTAGDDQSALVWDLVVPSSPRMVRRLTGHLGAVTSVATGPGGVVLTGSWDRSAIVWRVGLPPHVPVLPEAALAIASGGSRLLTRQTDGTGVLWESGRPVARFADASGGVALSHDGSVALIGGHQGATYYTPSTPPPTTPTASSPTGPSPTGRTSTPTGPAPASTGQAPTTSTPPTLSASTPAGPSAAGRTSTPSGPASTISAPASTGPASTTSTPPTLSASTPAGWSPAGPSAAGRTSTSTGPATTISASASTGPASTGSSLASTGPTPTTSSTPTAIGPTTPSAPPVTTSAGSAEAVGERELAVGRRVVAVALSGDGRRALVGGPDGVVLWAGGVEVVLPGVATAVGLSEDGLFGVTGSGGRLVPWDLRDPFAPRRGEPVEGHTGDVLALAVRDGLVLSGGADRKAVLWEITAPASLRAAGTLLGHHDAVGEVALGENVAVTAGADETVRVWLIRDPHGPREVQVLSRAGIGVAFGPGTSSIFASNVQGGVIRWDFRYLADAVARPLTAACALTDCEKGQENGGE